MIENIPEPDYTPEEIETLEAMRGDLLTMYKRASRLYNLNKDELLDWQKLNTLSNLMNAAGSCATGYDALTKTLKKAKPSPEIA